MIGLGSGRTGTLKTAAQGRLRVRPLREGHRSPSARPPSPIAQPRASLSVKASDISGWPPATQQLLARVAAAFHAGLECPVVLALLLLGRRHLLALLGRNLLLALL